jgi:hypothetical protein
MSRREKLDLIRLGETLSAELNAAADLWSWLPSHAVATEHHGDDALAQMPDVGDVMIEAAMYLAHLRRPDEPLTDEEREWFGRCPCGNSCEEQEGGI